MSGQREFRVVAGGQRPGQPALNEGGWQVGGQGTGHEVVTVKSEHVGLTLCGLDAARERQTRVSTRYFRQLDQCGLCLK